MRFLVPDAFTLLIYCIPTFSGKLKSMLAFISSSPHLQKPLSYIAGQVVMYMLYSIELMTFFCIYV